MKVSKEEAARHREALLKATAAQIREHGFSGVNVAQLAQSAGLTHGALYSHFGSKENLLAEACSCALTESRKSLEDAPLDKFISSYVSKEHRDHPESGCPISALVSDISRQPEAVRSEFASGIEKLVELLEEKVNSTDKKNRRRDAVAAVATIVGAIAVSRALQQDNKTLSDEFLTHSRAGLRDR